MAEQQGVTNGAGSEKAAATFTAMKPQLMVEAPKADNAVQFYKAAFGAVETSRSTHPKRKADQELPLILFAELNLAGSSFLVSDLTDDSAPVNKVGSGIALCLETEDVEAAIAKAVAAGAVAEGEITEGEGACCGERVGKFKDPYGFEWLICSSSAKKPCVPVEA